MDRTTIQRFNSTPWLVGASVLTIILVIATFFMVDLRYGPLHFDTYQYSAAIGPQASGLRPKLLGVSGVELFENGSEVTLPGTFWMKRAIYSWVTYSLRNDYILVFAGLVAACLLCSAVILRAGYGRLTAFAFFVAMLTDPTGLINVSGTRPEPLALLLLALGMLLATWKPGKVTFFSGALLLGLAGTVHVYAAFLGPLVLVALWVRLFRSGPADSWRMFLIGGLGLFMGWLVLAAFWLTHSDAWKLFLTNLSVQHRFQNNPWKFGRYLSEFRLGGGLLMVPLLVVMPVNAWIRWWRTQGVRGFPFAPLVVSLCSVVVPLSFMLLKTDQWFYGTMIWPAIVGAFLAGGGEGFRARSFVVALLLMIAAGGFARLAARAQLGYQLRGADSLTDQRREWLNKHLSEDSRLYVFTRDWDISFSSGNQSVGFYTFPLPMADAVVSEYQGANILKAPEGALVLYDRDFTTVSPYQNVGVFDPAKDPDWELLDSRSWHFNFSPQKPVSVGSEIWRKKKAGSH